MGHYFGYCFLRSQNYFFILKYNYPLY